MTNRWGRMLAALLLVGACAGRASAGLLYVDDDGLDPFDCSGAKYRTIADALHDAHPGDEIRLCPGVYTDQVVVTSDITITGVPQGTARPVIRPTALPVTKPSLLGPASVAAAIIIDGAAVRLADIDIDLSQVVASDCTQRLAGIYLRVSSGMVDGVRVFGTRLTGQPTCDDGVGMYIESGKIGEQLGRPIFGVARVRMGGDEFFNFQKAGVVARGPKTIILVKDGKVTGDGTAATVAQYGYQISDGARGQIARVDFTGLDSTLPSSPAGAILVNETTRVTVHSINVTNSQEGVLAAGDRVRVKKSSFSGMSGDGIAFLGRANVAVGNFVENAAVSGIFVWGDYNRVRGGVMRNIPVGVWFFEGFGNVFGGITYDNVAVAGEGKYGGARDFGRASIHPFTTQ